MTATKTTTCPICRTTLTWSGDAAGRVPCHRCGYQIPGDAALVAEEFLEDSLAVLRIITRINAGKATAAERATVREWNRRSAAGRIWREHRVASGLTVSAAADLLGIGPAQLSNIETGAVVPDRITHARMNRLYYSR